MDQYLVVPYNRIGQVREFLNGRIWPCRLAEVIESFPDLTVDTLSEVINRQNCKGFFVGPSSFNNFEASVYRNITVSA